MKILIAEDNVVNQKLAILMLQKLGHETDIAENGKIVLDKLEQNQYDFILMDIFMPLMNGYEATAEIINKYGDKKPLIVAMTASVLEGDKETCLAAGMDDYLTKPVSTAQFKELFTKWENKLRTQDNIANELTEEAILNKKSIQDIFELCDKNQDTLNQLLSLYISQSNEILLKVAQALQLQEYHDLKANIHTLKGISLNLGAQKIASLCKQIENLFNENSTQELEKLLENLAILHEETKKEILSFQSNAN